MQVKNVKIVVYVPLAYSDKVREAIGKAHGGDVGNYSYCSFSSVGVGRFKPNKKAKPFIGKAGKIEEVKEERIEFICRKNRAKKIITAIKKAHPYEEVALDVFPLMDENEL